MLNIINISAFFSAIALLSVPAEIYLNGKIFYLIHYLNIKFVMLLM